LPDAGGVPGPLADTVTHRFGLTERVALSHRVARARADPDDAAEHLADADRDRCHAVTHRDAHPRRELRPWLTGLTFSGETARRRSFTW